MSSRSCRFAGAPVSTALTTNRSEARAPRDSTSSSIAKNAVKPPKETGENRTPLENAGASGFAEATPKAIGHRRARIPRRPLGEFLARERNEQLIALLVALVSHYPCLEAKRGDLASGFVEPMLESLLLRFWRRRARGLVPLKEVEQLDASALPLKHRIDATGVPRALQLDEELDVASERSVRCVGRASPESGHVVELGHEQLGMEPAKWELRSLGELLILGRSPLRHCLVGPAGCLTENERLLELREICLFKRVKCLAARHK